MARFFEQGKGKKRLITALSLLLSATLSIGIISACNPADENEEDDNKTTSTVDTQTLKNGNFEFYSEMDEEDRDERRAFINSPNDWSFSSGSPSSDTSSGIVNTADWEYMTKSSFSLVPAEKEDEPELTSAVIKNATDNWDKASLYDRLEFYDYYDIDSSSEFELYGDYRYSIDFEDVQYLNEVNTTGLLHKDVAEDETSILMIHNHRTSDGVRGTAQYYTSSTTITLSAGTAAQLSVWVRTSELYHYGAASNEGEDIPVTARAGAYIGITNTVGGTTLDQVQIKNINTQDEWQQYTVYIRANTFATTTFRVVLGLGQGSSDNRYEAVDGYAFFDDLKCEIITEEKYEAAVTEEKVGAGDILRFGLDDKGDDRKFSATKKNPDGDKPAQEGIYTFALDLKKTFESLDGYKFNENTFVFDETQFDLTKEVSGSKTYTSQSIDSSLGHYVNEKDGNIIELVSYDKIKDSSNVYLKQIFADDFENKFPSTFDKDNIVLLLSTNGAAYTAKLPTIELAAKSRMLVSFFVKTSSIPSGKTGASAILVDGENKSSISAFDSTTVATVDIDSDVEELTDIYKGWVQCFFFVENATDDVKSFHIELTYGPTAIANTVATDYSDGYAAFANFQTAELLKTQYSYAATGTYAQKVSLTASVKDSTKFADAAANGTQLEDGLATPVGYTGVVAGSNVLVENGVKNPSKENLAVNNGVYTGLLSSEYAENYFDLDANETDVTNPEYLPNKWVDTLGNYSSDASNASDWWKNIFGNKGTVGEMAYQPLVIVNTSATKQPAYGFFASSTTVAANATSRISMRVKLSKGATAYIYLIDVSDVKVHGKSLQPEFPAITYWYDDDGNLVSKDPTASDFDEDKDILFTLEENGLYKNAKNENDTNYYANLSAYEFDDDGNLVTSDGTIAYYKNGDNYYAYYDKDTDKYDQIVLDLKDIAAEYARYTAPADASQYAAVIKVTGTDSDEWTTVSFYVQAGNTAKNYRLELWAGQRDYEEGNAEKSDGIPEGGYVFFDRYSTSTSSNYSTLRDAAAEAMLDYTDENGDYIYRDANDDEKLDSKYALYYTFTFFDSPSYVRYDKTQDTDKAGNPWASYKQSAYSEVLSWLYCEDKGGEDSFLSLPYASVSLFMSYAQHEVTVTPDATNSSNSSSSSSSSSSSTSSNSDGANIWLLLSSILLAVALVFAICAVVIRRVVKTYKQRKALATSKKTKPVKAEKVEKEEPVQAPAPAPEKKPEAKPDENDPYNE